MSLFSGTLPADTPPEPSRPLPEVRHGAHLTLLPGEPHPSILRPDNLGSPWPL